MEYNKAPGLTSSNDGRSAEQTWQSNGLVGKIAVDGASALAAACAVSPVMTIIDRAVVAAAATQTSALAAMRVAAKDAISRPGSFLISRPFRIMMVLYTGTYLVANTTDTVSSHREGLPASTTTSSGTKFATVTATNLGLSLYKDNCFAQTFGPTSKFLRPLPPVSFVPLVIRDGITLFFCFNVPAMVSDKLPEQMEQYVSRLSAAQLAAPFASQFLATPLHLLGLDLYNRPGKLSVRERMAVIRKLWLISSLARACRVIPAYGLGGVLNNDVRASLMKRLEGETA